MSGSVEIVTWIHEYELKALNKQLTKDGTDVEKLMQKALADLYTERVPMEERRAIQELHRIRACRRARSADGQHHLDRIPCHRSWRGAVLQNSRSGSVAPYGLRLRTYLSEVQNPHPDSFAGRFKNQQPITKEEFDQLVAQRLENTGHVSGAL